MNSITEIINLEIVEYCILITDLILENMGKNIKNRKNLNKSVNESEITDLLSIIGFLILFSYFIKLNLKAINLLSCKENPHKIALKSFIKISKLTEIQSIELMYMDCPFFGNNMEEFLIHDLNLYRFLYKL